MQSPLGVGEVLVGERAGAGLYFCRLKQLSFHISSLNASITFQHSPLHHFHKWIRLARLMLIIVLPLFSPAPIRSRMKSQCPEYFIRTEWVIMLRVTLGNCLRLAVMARKRNNYTARSLLELAGFPCVFLFVCLFVFAQPADKQQQDSDPQHCITGLLPGDERWPSKRFLLVLVWWFGNNHSLELFPFVSSTCNSNLNPNLSMVAAPTASQCILNLTLILTFHLSPQCVTLP